MNHPSPQVDSEIAIKGTSMALSHSRKTLDQQAEQAAKLDAAKAAEVREFERVSPRRALCVIFP